MNAAIMSVILGNQRRRRAARAEAARRQVIKAAALDLLSTANIEANIDVTDELLSAIKNCTKNGKPLRLKISGENLSEDGRLTAKIILEDEP